MACRRTTPSRDPGPPDILHGADNSNVGATGYWAYRTNTFAVPSCRAYKGEVVGALPQTRLLPGPSPQASGAQGPSPLLLQDQGVSPRPHSTFKPRSQDPQYPPLSGPGVQAPAPLPPQPSSRLSASFRNSNPRSQQGICTPLPVLPGPSQPRRPPGPPGPSAHTVESQLRSSPATLSGPCFLASPWYAAGMWW